MARVIDYEPEEPRVLSPRLLQHLADHSPVGPVTPEDVAAWWALIWPGFEARGYSQRGTVQAICAWWRRCKPEELEQARAARRAHLEAKELAELERLQREANAAAPHGNVRDLFSRVRR